MSALTVILLVKLALKVYIKNLLLFKDKTIYIKWVNMKRVLSLWDEGLYERWISITHLLYNWDPWIRFCVC